MTDGHVSALAVSPDRWGQPTTHAVGGSIAPWNAVMTALLDFRGDPMALACAAADDDRQLVMASIFVATFRLLSGKSPADPAVATYLDRARDGAAGATDREQRHLAALEEAAAGNFGASGRSWDAILVDHPQDSFALKASHEALFYVGLAETMLKSSKRVVANWAPSAEGYASAVGQHALALEELGHYAEAEIEAKLGLSLHPDDVWSAHALAHVYEMCDRHPDSIGFLRDSGARWSSQALSGHMWWHLALRHVAAGEVDEALALHDRELASVDDSDWFRLTDSTSLLWRLSLLGVAVGDRWLQLADKWRGYGVLHSCPFLDVHAAMALASARSDREQHFLSSFEAAPFARGSEVGAATVEVAQPLCLAISAFAQGRHDDAARLFEASLARLALIGGSLAQRQTIDRTYAASLVHSGQLDKARTFLAQERALRPGSIWALDGLVSVCELQGDADEADLNRKRLQIARGSSGHQP